MAWHARVLRNGWLCLGLMLGACVDTASKMAVDPSAGTFDVVKVDRVAGANVSAAPLFLLSLEGPPPPVVEAMLAALRQDAPSRQLAFVEQPKAKYLARGYLSAFTIGENTHFVYVWDVADAAKRVPQRVTDAVVVKGTAPDPWTLFSGEVLVQISAKSADDLAAVLSNTAEAQKHK